MLLSLVLFSTGCVATKTLTLDPTRDWIYTGPDVYGSYYTRENGVKVLHKEKYHYSEGLVVGPEPR